jgi:hypothetical protein
MKKTELEEVDIIPFTSGNEIDNKLDDGRTGILEEDSSGGEIKEPFNPALIRITPIPFTVDLLLKRIEDDALDLSPGFQRKGGIWKPETQSRLIESLLIRIPLPAFYMDATDDDKWLIVDGLQRTISLKNFVLDEKLKLSGLEFLEDKFVGTTFSQLPNNFKRRILEASLTVYKIEPGTPTNVKFNIFKRINTGGLPLSSQEIRHALNQGQAVTLISDLTSSEVFLKATVHGISDVRMAAQECVLRFMAFTLVHYTQYKPTTNGFDGFLSDTMARINRMDSDELEILKKRFEKSMNIAFLVLGKDAFRKKYKYNSTTRYPISKALFETWSVNLERLNDNQVSRLIERKNDLINAFTKLMNEREFDQSVSQGTGDVNKVFTRFSKIEKMIKEVLK